MLGLSQAQGIILAVGGAIFIAIAGGILVLRGRRREEADIPNAMRPGPSDPDLETPLLQKLQGWGVLLVFALAVACDGDAIALPARRRRSGRCCG